MLALGAAPAIVRIGSLMPVRSIVVPTTWQVAAINGVDMNFTSEELLLSMEEFSRRIIQPAVFALCRKIDDDALAELLRA